MELEKRKSNIFDDVPTNFINRALYACDTGNIEYLDYLIKVKNLNFNRRFKDEWILEGFDEAMCSIEGEITEIKDALASNEINLSEYLALDCILRKMKKETYNRYTDSCTYGSLLDGMLRYAIEAEQFEVVDYLLNQDADYSKCFQTFYTAMDYRLENLIDFLIESNLKLHTYSRGYVGDRILSLLKNDESMNVELKNKITNYVNNNFDIKKYKKEAKKRKNLNKK